MKNSKLKFSEYMQNISRSKSFGKFVLIGYVTKYELIPNFNQMTLLKANLITSGWCNLNFTLEYPWEKWGSFLFDS